MTFCPKCGKAFGDLTESRAHIPACDGKDIVDAGHVGNYWHDNPVGQPPAKIGDMKLFARADGLKDHFCVGRCAGAYWEFWNEDTKIFCSAGTVIVGEVAANAKLTDLLNQK